MKYRARIRILLLFWLAGFIATINLGSCTRIDTPPALQLTIIDREGIPLQDVMVGLFDELDQWSMLENPVQPWRETGSDGKVMFNNLKENVYYFYADADSLSNISTMIKTDDSLIINEIRKLTVIVE